MKRKDSFYRSVVVIALSSLALAYASAKAERYTAASNRSTSQGMAAMEDATRGGKYLFVYFWKQNDQQTQSMYRVFQAATQAMSIPEWDAPTTRTRPSGICEGRRYWLECSWVIPG